MALDEVLTSNAGWDAVGCDVDVARRGKVRKKVEKEESAKMEMEMEQEPEPLCLWKSTDEELELQSPLSH